jgi:hypothetical protein
MARQILAHRRIACPEHRGLKKLCAIVGVLTNNSLFTLFLLVRIPTEARNYKHMKQTKKTLRQFLIILLILSMIISLESCKKEEEQEQEVSRVFMLTSYYNYHSNSPDSLSVGFSTSLYSENLKVEINNKLINEYVQDNNFYTGNIDIIYEPLIQYNIILDDKTQTGSVEQPSVIEEVYCNGDTIKTYQISQIDSNNIYNIVWKDIGCDYYHFIAKLGDNSIDSILSSNYFSLTNEILSDTNYFSFKVNGINGESYSPNVSPSVSGSYGSGYIMAKTVNRFDIKLQD